MKNGIVYDTARTDLLRLASRDLLIKDRDGRIYTFLPNEDLLRKLRFDRIKKKKR